LGDWLAGALTEGNHAVTAMDETEYPDQGLSIDAAWALVAVGGHGAEAGAIGAWLAEPAVLDAYTGAATGEAYAAATAKAALAFGTGEIAAGLPAGAAQAQVDALIAALQERRQEDGRLTDDSQYGDYSTPFGQALGVIALVKAGADVDGPDGPAAYLAAAACPEGGFPAMFTAAGEIDGPEAECVTDIDATALVLQALATAGGHDETIAASVEWLLGLQQDDGAWGLEGPSVNSTGLVVATLESLMANGALTDPGAAGAAAKAGATWLVGVAGADGGLPVGASGASDLRASAQAALGLAGVGVPDLVG
jgi:hypothetical protein